MKQATSEHNDREVPRPYSSILADTEVIPESVLNIDQRDRTSIFSWKGQFSPQFVEAMLSTFTTPGDMIYDPFAGSGTVLTESARKKLPCIGVELNPAAYYMTWVNHICNKTMQERHELIKVASSQIITFHEKANNGDLSTWIASLEAKNLQGIFSLLAIICDLYKNAPTIELIDSKWQHLKTLICQLPFSQANVTTFNCDSRKVDIESDVVDCVLTSPPYINVINYHQQYRRSVESLGFDVLNIAQNEFGANRKHRGNRFYTVVQYVIDMAISIKETLRICKNGSRLIYVVGKESTVLGYKFCNSELIYRIFTEIFHQPFLMKQQRCFTNRYGKKIFEDILHFQCSKRDFNCSYENIVAMARVIARDALRDASLQDIPDEKKNKNLPLLLEAISKSEQIEASTNKRKARK
ncbi:hypothetical protein GFD22_08205 [Bifidobacterium avesanii]|uniref:site-specific DNA-methyltransferase (cytosine-N(4)-specific) n=2 Tax=Bifidobacterium avesanii TaxID=1798157 RepID=A0A7K3TIL3_9BIFI|nr:hypothetical protein [Bifidobacterium avesanii]